jgi:hypothetical protein
MTLHELIVAASEGDEGAWSAIVDRFEGLVWATTRAHRLSQAEAADVTQTTWLRLCGILSQTAIQTGVISRTRPSDSSRIAPGSIYPAPQTRTISSVGSR